jgi:hypothetical protein
MHSQLVLIHESSRTFSHEDEWLLEFQRKTWGDSHPEYHWRAIILALGHEVDLVPIVSLKSGVELAADVQWKIDAVQAQIDDIEAEIAALTELIS